VPLEAGVQEVWAAKVEEEEPVAGVPHLPLDQPLQSGDAMNVRSHEPLEVFHCRITDLVRDAYLKLALVPRELSMMCGDAPYTKRDARLARECGGDRIERAARREEAHEGEVGIEERRRQWEARLARSDERTDRCGILDGAIHLLAMTSQTQDGRNEVDVFRDYAR
jgi:hypothetical protein